MNILLLAHGFPYPPKDGWKVIDYNLIRILSKKHKIFLVCFIDRELDPAAIKHIEPYCTAIETVILNKKWDYWQKIISTLKRQPTLVELHRDGLMSEKIKGVLLGNRFDIIHVSGFIMGQYANVLDNIPKIIVPSDAFSLLYQKTYKKEKNYITKLFYYIKYRNKLLYESETYKRYDACYVVSPADKEYLKRLCPGLELCVIPNGVDINYFKPLDIKGYDSPSVVFTGNMDYRPNWDAVVYFCKSIFPIILEEFPHTKFYVVGRNPVREVEILASDNVIITGTVDDIRPYISKSLVYVSPLREGTGIKNKILEAMAMGKPIIATSASCPGIDLSDGENILIRDNEKGFADCAVDLFNNPVECRRIGENARILAKQYSWESTAKQVETLYEKVIFQHSGRYTHG